jgi:hypothetical protein
MISTGWKRSAASNSPGRQNNERRLKVGPMDARPSTRIGVRIRLKKAQKPPYPSWPGLSRPSTRRPDREVRASRRGPPPPRVEHNRRSSDGCPREPQPRVAGMMARTSPPIGEPIAFSCAPRAFSGKAPKSRKSHNRNRYFRDEYSLGDSGLLVIITLPLRQ